MTATPEPAAAAAEGAGAGAVAAADPALAGKLQRRLCGTVLGMEAVVIALAILPAAVLEHVRGGVAGGIGGGLAIVALLLAGVVGRPGMRWALVVGSALQVLVIAAGAVLPAMYVLGAIFAALWITGIWLARRISQQVAAGQVAGR
jgi:hypothetical protein